MLLVPLGGLTPRGISGEFREGRDLFADRLRDFAGYFAQILNKTRLPVIYIVIPDRLHHFGMAGNSLRQRHGQRAVEGICHIIPIVG